MSHLLDQLAFMDPQRKADIEANDTLADERAAAAMPADIHEWATTPHWDDVALFNSQTCREAP